VCLVGCWHRTRQHKQSGGFTPCSADSHSYISKDYVAMHDSNFHKIHGCRFVLTIRTANMSTHAHVHEHKCTHAHTQHTCAHTHTRMHTNTHTCTRTHSHTNTHEHTNTYTQMKARMHTHANTYTHKYTRACTYTHTHKHTHTHIHTIIHRLCLRCGSSSRWMTKLNSRWSRTCGLASFTGEHLIVQCSIDV
jgi:hypothetical protein